MSVMKKLLRNTRWTTYTGRLHVGIDMLVRPPIMSLVDDVDFRVHERKRLPERPAEMVRMIKDAGPTIADVVVLARRDNYDLVDRIAAAGLKVYMLTPSELHRFAGIKNVHDAHDAYWMAHLLRAGALSLGEIYFQSELREPGPHPDYPRAQVPSLSSRLKLPRPRVVELGGNRHLSKHRKY